MGEAIALVPEKLYQKLVVYGSKVMIALLWAILPFFVFRLNVNNFTKNI
ncbi:MAG: hypothetical protein ICV78_04450 [Tolypothrix sp. Co-bin9]|nr:hypothetical protein [Tolypothrix sp. Co-bin9]